MTSEKKRILCAEPHDETRQEISTLLGVQGHEVVLARTVKECVDAARGERFDLYMLDDGYEDGTSIELCRELRSLSPETPILFFSAHALSDKSAQPIETAPVVHLPRPDDIFEIVRTVNSVLACRSSAVRGQP